MAKTKPMSWDEIYSQFDGLYQPHEQTYIPSGSVIFDILFSDGKGVPLGTFIELYSQAGIGKSTCALHMCKQACQLGHKAIYLDVEHAVNPSQLSGIGLDPFIQSGQFKLYPIVSFKDAEDIMSSVIEDPDLTYIIIDSITAMIPDPMLDKDASITDVLPGLHARYSNMFLQKFKPLARKHNTTILLVNQMRTKLDFRRGGYDAPAGGNALQYYCDIITQIKLRKKLEHTVLTGDGKSIVPYGSECEAITIKNKHANPYIPMTLTIFFGKGVSNNAAYLSWLDAAGYADNNKAGSYTLKLPSGEYKARGMKKALDLVRDNIQEIKDLIQANGGWRLLAGEQHDEDDQ